MSVYGLVNPESEELGAFAFPVSDLWARESSERLNILWHNIPFSGIIGQHEAESMGETTRPHL
jgi:hypothetical protein